MTTSLRERIERVRVDRSDDRHDRLGRRGRSPTPVRPVPVTYRFEAFDPERGVHTGVVTAADRLDAIGQIRGQGLRPLTITTQRPSLMSRELRLPGSGPKVKPRDLAVFARQLAAMLDAGISVVSALDVQNGQTTNRALAEAIDDIQRSLRGGESLSASMARHPTVFDPVFTAMVGAGEASGSLADVLKRLSFALERRVAVRSKIRSALGYPIAVLTLTGLIVIAMLLFVVPVFVSMYEQLDGELPLATRTMIGMSNLLRGNVLLVAAAAVASGVGFGRWRRSDAGRRALDRLLLRLPIAGGLASRAALARFSRTLAVLVRAGVPILEALALGARAVGNRVHTEAVDRVAEQVTRGSTLAEPLAHEPVFPALVGQLVSVGEQTGELDTMLDLMGGYYEDDLDHAVDSLTSLLEPALMMILGVVVGTVVLTLYLPMFKLIEFIQ